MYSYLPLGLYGTIWILVAAYGARFISHSVRLGVAGFVRTGRDLDEAARIAGERMAADLAHALQLRERLLAGLSVLHRINGDLDRRWPGNLNLSFPGITMPLLPQLPGLAISSGSACAAVTGRASHVLTALGLPELAAKASLRLGFGRFTTPAEIDTAATLINAAVRQKLAEVG